MDGVSTSNLEQNNLIGNFQGSTCRIPAMSLSRQLAATGALADALQQAATGRRAYATQAELLAVTASSGAVALVTSDPDPALNGQYRRSDTGWTRFADLDNEEIAQEVQSARASAPDLGQRLDGMETSTGEAQALARDLSGRLVAAAGLPALSEAGVALAFVDKDSGTVAAWIDRDGRLHAELTGAAARLPVPARDYVPLWGAVRDGRFMGFDTEGEVIGEIGRALGRAGIAPDGPGYGLDWQMAFRGRDGQPVLAVRPNGGIVDFGRARAPVIGTEWLTLAGTRVAPFTAGAVECVVAYVRDGARRVLTPPKEGVHYSAPELAIACPA